jgi:hypothetical protein
MCGLHTFGRSAISDSSSGGSLGCGDGSELAARRNITDGFYQIGAVAGSTVGYGCESQRLMGVVAFGSGLDLPELVSWYVNLLLAQ